jgi:LAO/AO transport system kinase
MVDVFFAILLAGAGDELQGIKRGLLELVDLIAVNKADGRGIDRAQRAVGEIRNALHILRGGTEVPVLACSALRNVGIGEVFQALQELYDRRRESNELQSRRLEQDVSWMWAMVRAQVDRRLHSKGQDVVRREEAAVRAGERSVMDAAAAIFGALIDRD